MSDSLKKKKKHKKTKQKKKKKIKANTLQKGRLLKFSLKEKKNNDSVILLIILTDTISSFEFWQCMMEKGSFRINKQQQRAS